MKHIFRKTILLVFACLMAGGVFGQNLTFSANEIKATTTKGSITVSTTFDVKSEGQICKENGKNIKVPVVEGKSTATDVNVDYTEIVTTSEITMLRIHGTTNSSTAGKKMGFVYWGENIVPNYDNTLASDLIEFPSYDKGCDDNYIDINIPTGTRTIRIYRQLKGFDGVKYEKNSKYGDGQTYYIADIEISSVTEPSVDVTGITLDKSDITLEQGDEQTLVATVMPADATDKTVRWTSSDASVASVDSNGKVTALNVGTATITATAGGYRATCQVTVTASSNPVAVTGITLDKNSLSMQVGQTQTITATISPANATNKAVVWNSTNAAVASVSNGLIMALAAGTTTISVVAQDGNYTATCNVDVTDGPPVPETSLSIHETEIYEASVSDGGYGGTLSAYNGREYEVYYVTRDTDSKNSVAVVANDKTQSITTDSSNSFTAKDGWFSASFNGASSESGASARDEFMTSVRRINMQSGNELLLHIKGYDQFSIYAKDNNTTNDRFFVVKVDGVEQPAQINNSSFSIRRYDISTGEHLISVSTKGGSNSQLASFSLRVAYVPKLKHITGNDSTQSVLQTDNIKPITYYLKNRIADAELSWEGAQATGIGLQKGTNDTLYLQGTANCPNGEYRYTISAKDENGAVVSTISGKFNVTSKIVFQRANDSIVTVYEKSAMSPVVFRYYSINSGDVKYSWNAAIPAGLNFNIDNANHTLTLSGTPTTVGTFDYTVSLDGANSLNGRVIVESNSPTVVPGAKHTMLYLYKTQKDGLYSELIRSYNYFARPAGGATNATATDYKEYDFIVISEDVDANNDEVINIIKNIKKPVLNMKNFTYTTSRLNWGYPDNGSVTNTAITILQPQHAVFSGMNVKAGDKVNILSKIDGRGLMPVDVTYQGTYALAAAAMQSETSYYDDGENQTFIHEVPASLRGAKYILFPVSGQSAGNLTSDGKKLLKNIIDYLLSNDAPKVVLPELGIVEFSINGHKANINQVTGEITLQLPSDTKEEELRELTPVITLADPSTKVTPNSGTMVDFSDTYFGVDFVVSDFINTKTYTAYVTITPTGLEDIFGNDDDARNDDIVYTITGQVVGKGKDVLNTLPQGLYIINGKKIAITR